MSGTVTHHINSDSFENDSDAEGETDCEDPLEAERDASAFRWHDRCVYQ